MKQVGFFQFMLVGLPLLTLPTPMTGASASTGVTVYQSTKDSIYPLYIIDKKTKKLVSVGSAVAVTKDRMATNCHVLQLNAHFVTESSHKTFPVDIIQGSRLKDICLLKSSHHQLKPAVIRQSSDVKVGEQVYAVGNPKGSLKTITVGIVSNKLKSPEGTWLQTDATINLGSSGGGLFDYQGKLIGITTALDGRLGYALPTEWVTDLLNKKKVVKNKKKLMLKTHASGEMNILGKKGRASLYSSTTGDCFALIQGKSNRGLAHGFIYWSKEHSNILVIFPESRSTFEVIGLVHTLINGLQDPKHQLQPTDFTLLVRKNEFPVFQVVGDRLHYPLLVVQVGESVTKLMTTSLIRSSDIVLEVNRIPVIRYVTRDIKSLFRKNKHQCESTHSLLKELKKQDPMNRFKNMPPKVIKHMTKKHY